MLVASQNEGLGSKTWEAAFHPVFNSKHQLKLTLHVVLVLIVESVLKNVFFMFLEHLYNSELLNKL